MRIWISTVLAGITLLSVPSAFSAEKRAKAHKTRQEIYTKFHPYAIHNQAETLGNMKLHVHALNGHVEHFLSGIYKTRRAEVLRILRENPNFKIQWGEALRIFRSQPDELKLALVYVGLFDDVKLGEKKLEELKDWGLNEEVKTQLDLRMLRKKPLPK